MLLWHLKPLIWYVCEYLYNIFKRETVQWQIFLSHPKNKISDLDTIRDSAKRGRNEFNIIELNKSHCTIQFESHCMLYFVCCCSCTKSLVHPTHGSWTFLPSRPCFFLQILIHKAGRTLWKMLPGPYCSWIGFSEV